MFNFMNFPRVRPSYKRIDLITTSIDQHYAMHIDIETGIFNGKNPLGCQKIKKPVKYKDYIDSLFY